MADIDIVLTPGYGEMGIEDNTTATTIRGTDQWQAITSNAVTGNVNGFTFDAGLLGEIASTSGTGTVATITDVAHGLVAGDIITINGTTSYNGVYEVASAPTVDTFTIASTATANETGYWQKGASLTVQTGFDGVYQGVWNSSGISAVNAHVFEFAPFVNTTRDAKATSKRKFSNADFGAFGGTGLPSLVAGDVVWFGIKNITATGDLTIYSLGFNLLK